MEKNKILYVITKLELGGAQKQLLSLIANLDKDKYSAYLFTSEGILLNQAYAIPGLNVKISRFLIRPLNPFYDILALIELYRFIKNNNITFVHTHSSKAGILGRLSAAFAKVRCIVHTVHGWSFNEYQPFFLRLLYRSAERCVCAVTHVLIAVSNYDMQKGINNGIGGSEKYRVIRYGINQAEFNGVVSTVREELGLNKDDLAVGTISCFKPQKALGDFIKAGFLIHQTCPKVNFIIVGDGQLRRRLERLINKFNLKEKFRLIGWRNDIPQVLEAIDVFTLTSLWEGLPVSVLEALQSSKPVVATDSGGIQEVILEGKNGFLVRPRDSKGLADKVSLLLNNAELRREMAKNAKDSICNSDFSVEKMVMSHHDLYEELLKGEYAE